MKFNVLTFLLKISYALVFLVLFVYFDDLPNSFYLSKGVWLMICTTIVTIVAAFSLFYNRSAFILSSLDYLTVCLLVLQPMINCLFFNNTESEAREYILCGILYFSFRIIHNSIERRTIVQSFMEVFFFSTAIELVIVICQQFGALGYLYKSYGFMGSFPNTGPFGIYMAFCFVVITVFLVLVKELSLIVKICGAFISILCFYFVILSFSRSAWVGISFACVILLLTHFKTQILGFGKRYWVYFLSAIPTIFLLSLYVFKLKEKSAIGRTLTWRISINMFKDNWLFGVGEGRFSVNFGKYQGIFFENAKNNALYGRMSGDVRFAFNDLLQFFCEKGLFGGVLFLSVLFTLYKINRKIWERGDNFSAAFHTSLFFGLATITISGLFSYPLQITQMFVIFWLSISVLESLNDCKKLNSFARLNKPQLFLLPFLLVTIAYFAAHRARQTYKANVVWNNWKNVTDGSYSKDIVALEPDLSESSDYLFDVGSMYMHQKNYKAALKYFKRSQFKSPNKEIFYAIGFVYEKLGDNLSAEKEYFTIGFNRPNLLRPIYLRALLYYNCKNWKQFDQLVNVVLNFKPKVNSPEIEEMKIAIKFLSIRRKNNRTHKL